MPSATWVVYAVPTKDGSDGARGVCEQREWEKLSAASPGALTLIRAGIAHEGEAERLARGTAGEAKPRAAGVMAASWAERAAARLSRATPPPR
jgi:hypothetical protein